MLLFQMPNAIFNGGSTFHQTPETFDGSSFSSLIDMNIDVTDVPVPAVSHINKDVIWWAGHSFDLHKGVLQGIAIVGIAMDRLLNH